MNFQYFKILICTLIFVSININSNAQGLNHSFLIGYASGLDSYTSSLRGIIKIDSNSIIITPANFKIPFRGAQANISDENGNLLIVTNGCWIADANGNTMQNGGGLNPGGFTNSWCDATTGIPDVHSNVILPWPGDSTKYILFHQTGNYNMPNSISSELFYTTIDITQNGGLGSVIQKNMIAFQDTLDPGMAACKHANGRDWWVVIFKDKTDIIYKLLLTPSGISVVHQFGYFDYQILNRSSIFCCIFVLWQRTPNVLKIQTN